MEGGFVFSSYLYTGQYFFDRYSDVKKSMSPYIFWKVTENRKPVNFEDESIYAYYQVELEL